MLHLDELSVHLLLLKNTEFEIRKAGLNPHYMILRSPMWWEIVYKISVKMCLVGLQGLYWAGCFRTRSDGCDVIKDWF